MVNLEKFGKHPVTGRTMYLLELDSLEDWPEELGMKSPHFVLFLACDARDIDDDDLAAFAGAALGQGMVYLSVWGEDAERVHDVFDETDADVNPDSTADSVVLSEWHEDEPLAEALRFAVATASPAHDHESTCRATLCVSVGNPDWAERMRGWLEDPEGLEAAVEDSGDGEAEDDLGYDDDDDGDDGDGGEPDEEELDDDDDYLDDDDR